MKLLEKFKNDLGLTDIFKDIKIDEKWSILDYILIRQGKEINLSVVSAGEDESFVTEEGPLSDHPALFLELLIKE